MTTKQRALSSVFGKFQFFIKNSRVESRQVFPFDDFYLEYVLENTFVIHPASTTSSTTRKLNIDFDVKAENFLALRFCSSQFIFPDAAR